MEDLSKKYYGDQSTGLTAGTSMSAGNTTTIPGAAMQAPGSKPVNPLPLGAEVDDPAMEVPPVKGPTVLVDSHGNKAGE
jgi:hypothetical protein